MAEPPQKFDISQITQSYTQAHMIMSRFANAWNLSVLKEMLPEEEYDNSVMAANILQRLYTDFTGASNAGQYEMGMYAAWLLNEWGSELINWANNLRVGIVTDPPYNNWNFAMIPVRIEALQVPHEHIREALDAIAEEQEQLDKEEKRARRKKRKKGKKHRRNPDLDKLLELQTQARTAIKRMEWLWAQVLNHRGISADELPMFNVEYGHIVSMDYQAYNLLAYGDAKGAMDLYAEIIFLAEDINQFLNNRLKMVLKFDATPVSMGEVR